MSRGVIIVVVIAVAAAILVLGAILQLWIWLIGAGFILLTALIWYAHVNNTSQRSQGFAAALSALAFLFGAYWYMVERPGAAKLNLVLAGQAFRASQRNALVFLEVEVQNVGNSPVSFEGRPAAGGANQAKPAREASADQDCRPESTDAGGASAPSLMMIRVGMAVPIAADLGARLECATFRASDSSPVALARADLWPPVASVDQNLITKIEAGESEKYYYRLLVPCRRRLVLAVTARIPKRATFTDTLVHKEPVDQVWIGQRLVDASTACAK